MTFRKDQVFKAKLAQQTNRFDIMVESMKIVVKLDPKLTEEERGLLSIAYKNSIGKKRLTLKTIRNMENIEEMKGINIKLEMIKKYRIQLENELRAICYEILDLLDQYLIPTALTVFTKAFYHKMQGDYYQCLSELTTGDQSIQLIHKTRVSYINATNNLWSQLRIDIHVLAQLYDWGEENVEKSSLLKQLSCILRSVETYFKVSTPHVQQLSQESSNNKFLRI